MEKLWKKVVLAVVLLFSFGIFAPCVALADTATPTEIDVDVKIPAEDKVYDTNKSVEDNLKTSLKLEDIEVVPESSEYKNLLKQYNVKATYSGSKDVVFNAPTIGVVPVNPVNIDPSKVKITPESVENGRYKFVLKNVSAVGNLIDNSTPAIDEEGQIEEAKEAENMLYGKLKIGVGSVPSFNWSGSKASFDGGEGSIELKNNTWEMFSSARSGYKGVSEKYCDDWIIAVKDELRRMKAEGIKAQDVKMTEWEKLALAVTAVGYDPRDITYDGSNLIDIISNKDYLNASSQTFARQYAILALTSQDYINSVPKDEKHVDENDIEDKIHSLADLARGNTAADGSTILSNAVPDMGTMQMQPLAAYYDSNAKEEDKYYDVKQAVEYWLDHFSNSQTYLGSFWGGMGNDYNNSWTNAQVYMTIGMAAEGNGKNKTEDGKFSNNVNIFDKKYIKCGKTMIDAALNKWSTYDSATYEPTQMCRGLDSLVRAYEGRNSIFDCRDVENSTVPVNNAIEALPDAITSKDEEKINAAKVLYDALGSAKQASIAQSTKDKLAAAERKVGQTVEISDPDASYKKVSVKAKNVSDSSQNVSLITALYDETGKFITYVSGEQKVEAGRSSTLSNMLKIPEEGIYKIKTFVWDSIEGMKPLSNVIDMPAGSGK